MKKRFILTIAILIGALSMAGCAEVLPEKVQVIVNEKKDEFKDKAASELQKALSEQINDFIHSNDLSKTLGLSTEEEEQFSLSLKEYLESYDSDTDEWKKAFDSITKSINEWKEKDELKGLSKDELDKKINELLNKEK